ncbi:hypothetical protein AOLI_G00075580 [Acnodon oligacanthus]
MGDIWDEASGFHTRSPQRLELEKASPPGDKLLQAQREYIQQEHNDQRYWVQQKQMLLCFGVWLLSEPLRVPSGYTQIQTWDCLSIEMENPS